MIETAARYAIADQSHGVAILEAEWRHRLCATNLRRLGNITERLRSLNRIERREQQGGESYQAVRDKV